MEQRKCLSFSWKELGKRDVMDKGNWLSFCKSLEDLTAGDYVTPAHRSETPLVVQNREAEMKKLWKSSKGFIDLSLVKNGGVLPKTYTHGLRHTED